MFQEYLKKRNELLRCAKRDRIIKNVLVLKNGIYHINDDILIHYNTIPRERVQKCTRILRKPLHPIERKVREWWSRRSNT